MKYHFHMKGWALRLALRKKSKVIRKWPDIESAFSSLSLRTATAVSRTIALTVWVPCDKPGNRPVTQRVKTASKKNYTLGPSPFFARRFLALRPN